MKLITNKNGKELNYNEIITKQENYRRRKQRLNDKADRDDKRTFQLHQIRNKSFYSELNCKTSQIKLHARLQPSAQKLVDEAHADMSLFEVSKLISQKAREFEKITIEENDQFFTPLENWGINYLESSEEQTRRKAWIDNITKKPAYGAFYVVANIPSIKLKFDTRQKVFVYDKTKRKSVKKPEMAVYDNYNATRWSVINKILMRIGYEISDDDNDLKRRTFLNNWLSENNLELTSSFVHVPSVHNDNIEEFPALIFSLSRDKNSPTQYMFNPDHGVHRRVDEQVVEVSPETKATISTPLSHYELEDYTIKGALDGNLDNTKDVVIESIENAYNENARGARNRLIIDCPEGIDAYANLALSLDRQDLVLLATDEFEPECPMDTMIADAIWNGEMNHEDAIILYGNIYKDALGVYRQGLYLRSALDVLVNANVFGDIKRDEVDELYEMQLYKLGLKK